MSWTEIFVYAKFRHLKNCLYQCNIKFYITSERRVTRKQVSSAKLTLVLIQPIITFLQILCWIKAKISMLWGKWYSYYIYQIVNIVNSEYIENIANSEYQ